MELEDLLLFFLRLFLSFFIFDGLKEKSAEGSHFLTPQKVLLHWKQISDKYLIRFFPLIIGQVWHKEVIVEEVNLITFCFRFNGSLKHIFSFLFLILLNCGIILLQIAQSLLLDG